MCSLSVCCVCHLVNMKLGSLTLLALQTFGDENFVPEMSGKKIMTGSMKAVVARLFSKLQLFLKHQDKLFSYVHTFTMNFRLYRFICGLTNRRLTNSCLTNCKQPPHVNDHCRLGIWVGYLPRV